MQRYQVLVQPSAHKTLRKLPKDVQHRIIAKMESLADDPRPIGAIKLKGEEDDYWRLRVGDYRIVYEIEDEKLFILVLRIGHRKDIFRD